VEPVHPLIDLAAPPTVQATTESPPEEVFVPEDIPVQRLACGDRQYKKNGRIMDGGRCVRNAGYTRKIQNSDDPAVTPIFDQNF